LPADAEPWHSLETLNERLFAGEGYVGNAGHYYDPQNSYFNRVMDRRTGNPISLCTLYLFVARRMHLPVAGVGMPGHFLCRYQSSKEEIYIDAFHGGRLLSKADCVRHLTQTSYGFQEGFLSPVTPRRMLLRMCANLHQIHLHLRDKEETSRFHRYVVALAK
jgi:regulator of sirC expression with transglutaminase-like and TPR domain